MLPSGPVPPFSHHRGHDKSLASAGLSGVGLLDIRLEVAHANWAVPSNFEVWRVSPPHIYTMPQALVVRVAQLSHLCNRDNVQRWPMSGRVSIVGGKLPLRTGQALPKRGGQPPESWRVRPPPTFGRGRGLGLGRPCDCKARNIM